MNSVRILSILLAVILGISTVPLEGVLVAQEETAPEETAAEEAPAEMAEEAPPEGNFTAIPPSSEDVPPDQRLQPSPLGLDERVSLDLRNIEAGDALRFLAQKGGLNLAISKSVTGRVQLLLNSVPIRDILDIILITNALAFEKIGDVYYIMTEIEYKERFGRKFSDTRLVKVFKLQYAVPEQVFSLFDVLKSEIGRLLVDPDSGTVLVMDTPQNIERMESALQTMEQKKTVKVYPLKYGKAIDVEARLKTRLDAKKVGSAVADERTNSVIVDTLPERIAEIDRIVSSLDEKTREVLVDAKVIKVTISNSLAAEIKWEGLYQNMYKFGELFIGNHPVAALARTGRSAVDDFVNIAPTTTPAQTAKNALTENLVFGSISGDKSFEALMNFLRTIGDTRILSNPKIACVSNQEAKILVGQKQAYVTTTTTTSSGGGSTVAENVTFIDVGIQLAVTPVVNEDGFVTMKIKPEVSSVGTSLVTPSGNTIPIVDTSTAETTVMVRDGVSILIGGLRRDEKTETRKKVPVLGDIPFFGAAFNSFTDTTAHTELLILITPHIVYGNTLVTGETKAVDRLFKTYTDYSGASLDMKKVELPKVEVKS